MPVRIYWPEGCDIRSDNVEGSNIETHIAALDFLSGEAELLKFRKADEQPGDDWECLADCDHGDTDDDPHWIETWEWRG